MSRASQVTLAAAFLGTIATIAFVYNGQRQDKAAMHAGVIRDFEQQRIKRERQADFEMQRELEQEYRKLQTVSDGGGPAAEQGRGSGS